MKARVYLATLCLLLAANIHAQHFITGSLQGGWSSTFDNMEQTQAKGLLGAQIGVGYEWQYERLLLDLGVEFSYYNHRWKINDQTITQPMIDTEGWPFVYNGTLTNRSDNFSSTSVRVPLLAGMQFGKFYFLAGVIPDFHFNGTAHATGTLHTEGDYTEFYSTLINMANHGFYDVAQSSEREMRYKIDFLAHAELGVSFGENQKYRLAAFGEIGMLDISPRTDIGKMTAPDFSRYLTVNLNHPYISTEGMFASAHNYEAGVKFSVAINVANNKEKKDKDDDDDQLDSLDNAMQDSLDNILFAEAMEKLEAEAEAEAQRSAMEAAAAIAAEEQAEREREEELRRQQEAEKRRTEEYAQQSKTFGPNTELSKDELGKGSQYTLQHIYFDTDLAIIQITSLPTLKQLYKHLVQYPNLRIKIIGHTDSQANDRYNLVLSRRRANSVKQVLIRWGIDPARLETEGRGETEPVASNRTAKGRQLNRRVVFEVL